jgi:hypothetical protein
MVEKGPAQDRAGVPVQLTRRLCDADFARGRRAALALLPEADRPEWQKLWAEALRQRAAKAQEPAKSSQPGAPESPGQKK